LLDGKKLDPIADDQDLLLSGLVDSLGVVRMISFIEQTMEVAIPPEDVTLENFQTVDNIVRYLQQRSPG
jgi:acyl carrier protein